jgi:hypothetical protein
VRDPRPTRRPRRRAALSLGALGALLALGVLVAAGCGGGSSDNGVARADTSSQDSTSSAEDGSSTTSTTSTTSDADREEAALKFAKCMRDQGLDFPDPKPDSEGRLRFQIPRGAAGNRDKFQSAAQNCQQYLEDVRGQISPEQQAEFRDAQLKYAKCMRAEGVDVPDPEPGGFGAGPAMLKGVDPDDPKFQAANEKCQRYLAGARARIGGNGP